jgi:hypothetical protein
MRCVCAHTLTPHSLAEITYQEYMRRAADAAAGRELRIKAKLQEVCP